MKLNRAATALGIAALCASAGSASASIVNIDWLDMGPTLFGSSVPNNSNFNLPGVGLVNVTYSIPAGFSDARTTNPLLQNGSVVSGPDTYSWSAHELFGATNLVPADPIVGVPWRITFTLPSTVSANRIYVGVAGLGQTTSFGGGATTATVNQNGTFLGDWVSGGGYGPTQFAGGAGTFTMQNSLTGAGGADPWWNTELGVVQINDAVSSITVDFMHIAGDGAGVNIGYSVPAPGSVGLLGAAGLLATTRRRRA
jgi:hypothetical protein